MPCSIMPNRTIKINWALLTLLTRGYVLAAAVQAVAAAVAENSTGMQQADEGKWSFFCESTCQQGCFCTSACSTRCRIMVCLSYRC
jgi:hypothetical protein